MQFELSPIQLLTICAVLNGLIFGLLLLDKKENRQANRFLSLMMLCLSLTFTPYMVAPSIWHQYRWMVWMPFSLSYWIGPSLYFYVRALTRPEVNFRRKDWWHFSPIVLNYLHSFYHLFLGNSNPFPWLHVGAELLESAAILSIFIYMIGCYRMINRYQKSLLDFSANPGISDLKWVKGIVTVLMIAFSMILVFLIVSSGVLGKHELHLWGDHLAVILFLYAAMLYWFSIHGYRQAQMIAVPIYRPVPQKAREFSEVLLQLEKAMSEGCLYRQSDLSLADLSKAVGIAERTISNTINGELQKNFHQFVNGYRVEEMKQRLLDPQNAHLTIFSIALDVGFNSKASFNRVFKASTGCTPQQFRTRHS